MSFGGGISLLKVFLLQGSLLPAPSSSSLPSSPLGLGAGAVSLRLYCTNMYCYTVAYGSHTTHPHLCRISFLNKQIWQ